VGALFSGVGALSPPAARASEARLTLAGSVADASCILRGGGALSRWMRSTAAKLSRGPTRRDARVDMHAPSVLAHRKAHVHRLRRRSACHRGRAPSQSNSSRRKAPGRHGSRRPARPAGATRAQLATLLLRAPGRACAVTASVAAPAVATSVAAVITTSVAPAVAASSTCTGERSSSLHLPIDDTLDRLLRHQQPEPLALIGASALLEKRRRRPARRRAWRR